MHVTLRETEAPTKHERPPLELIDAGKETQSHSTPMLFVHGAAHAAWCWQEHFLDYFAGKGYHAIAVSLGGHGRSAARKPLSSYSIDDYVDDLASPADTLPTAPVLIGHSMGGFVIQKYLDTHRAPATVLLASVPPRHSAGIFLRMLRRHPWRMTMSNLTGNQDLLLHDPKWTRETFFSSHTPAEDVARWTTRLGPESLRAQWDVLLASRPRPQRVSDPVLVIGADEDGCCPKHSTRVTARAYHTSAEIFPGMGHDMMLEPGWTAVADRIDGWLTELGL